MGRLIIGLVVVLVGVGQVVEGVVITFDDHPDVQQDTYGPIGSYKGFHFDAVGGYVNRLDWIDTVGSEWDYGSVSGDFTMLNAHGGSGVITEDAGEDFIFGGLWARKWLIGDPYGNIIGKNNGSTVWTVHLTLTDTWTEYGEELGVIDELVLELGNHFLIDNLTLNEPSSVVPEPSSLVIWSLIALSFGGFGLWRKRKTA